MQPRQRSEANSYAFREHKEVNRCKGKQHTHKKQENNETIGEVGLVASARPAVWNWQDRRTGRSTELAGCITRVETTELEAKTGSIMTELVALMTNSAGLRASRGRGNWKPYLSC